jgi:hypothetical protein
MTGFSLARLRKPQEEVYRLQNGCVVIEVRVNERFSE